VGDCYQIADWDDYEVNDKGRAWRPGDTKRAGPLEYVRVTVYGRGWPQGYRDFLAVAKVYAPAALGVWTKLLELAGDQPAEFRDGIIRDRHGEPADADTIADLVGFRRADVLRALRILAQPRVGWVIKLESPGSRKLPETPGTVRDALIKADQDKADQDKGGSCPETPTDRRSGPKDNDSVVFTFPCDGTPDTWELRQSKGREWQRTYKTIDVAAECRKARQWLLDNPSRRKTARGMTRFLGSWFSRAVNNPRKPARPAPNAKDAPHRSDLDLYADALAEQPEHAGKSRAELLAVAKEDRARFRNSKKPPHVVPRAANGAAGDSSTPTRVGEGVGAAVAAMEEET